MKRSTTSRRRTAVHITLARAARLHRLVRLLGLGPRSREEILNELAIGLRTFYRELELLNRCGVKVQFKNKAYRVQSTTEQAEGRLPFPDPQLSFAEMAELSRHPGGAAKRLAELLASVVNLTSPPRKGGARGRKGANAKRSD